MSWLFLLLFSNFALHTKNPENSPERDRERERIREFLLSNSLFLYMQASEIGVQRMYAFIATHSDTNTCSWTGYTLPVHVNVNILGCECIYRVFGDLSTLSAGNKRVLHVYCAYMAGWCVCVQTHTGLRGSS